MPTVNIAPAKGWPIGATPTAAPGLAVNAYASGLDHPRWLYVLPNGDVLVAESNAPPKPEAKTRERPVAGSTSRMAARLISFSMPFSATLLFEPTVTYKRLPSRLAMTFLV